MGARVTIKWGVVWVRNVRGMVEWLMVWYIEDSGDKITSLKGMNQCPVIQIGWMK